MLNSVYAVACGKQLIYWGTSQGVYSASLNGSAETIKILSSAVKDIKALVYKGETLFILADKTSVYKANHEQPEGLTVVTNGLTLTSNQIAVMDSFIYVTDSMSGLYLLHKHPTAKDYDDPRPIYTKEFKKLRAITTFKSNSVMKVVSVVLVGLLVAVQTLL